MLPPPLGPGRSPVPGVGRDLLLCDHQLTSLALGPVLHDSGALHRRVRRPLLRRNARHARLGIGRGVQHGAIQWPSADSDCSGADEIRQSRLTRRATTTPRMTNRQGKA